MKRYDINLSKLGFPDADIEIYLSKKDKKVIIGIDGLEPENARVYFNEEKIHSDKDIF